MQTFVAGGAAVVDRDAETGQRIPGLDPLEDRRGERGGFRWATARCIALGLKQDFTQVCTLNGSLETNGVSERFFETVGVQNSPIRHSPFGLHTRLVDGHAA